MFCLIQRHVSAIRSVLRPLCRTSLSWAAVAVPLAYETQVPPPGHGALDSPAVWIAPDPRQSLLLVTDKTQDWIEIHDPVRNVYLGRLGGSGSAPGRLARPNSVAVVYGVPTVAGPLDVMFVVERGNHRISAFYLPWGLYLGTFGNADLSEPMGIAVHWEGAQLQLWITDIGPRPQSVVVFNIVPTPTGVGGVKQRAIPMPSGAVLESIEIDALYRHALICDEAARDVMIYSLEGQLLGRFGQGHFTSDTEGLRIFDSGNGNGYVIVTDQMAVPVEWEVFDRRDYSFLLNFSGVTTATDGIALIQTPLPNFPQGALWASHADRAVHAYDWRDIAAATGLCASAPCIPVDANEPGAETASAMRPWVQPFPSPMRGAGTLRFRLAAPAVVDVSVYDLRGARVASLTNTTQPAGWHELAWDGRGRTGARLPSGVYFVRTRIAGETFAHKMTLLR